MDPRISAPSDYASFSEYYRNALGHFPQEHRSGGSFGVNLMQVDQDAAEFVDPPIGELSIVGVISKNVRAEVDFGDGWTPRLTYRTDFVGPQPADQACGFRIADPSSLLIAHASASRVSDYLEQVGIYDDPFRPLYATFDHSPIIMSCLRGMWHALDTGGVANSLLVDAYFIAVLGHMLRNQGDRTAFALVPDLGNRQLTRAIDYIETHYASPLLTSELAGIAGMSVAQFGRSFKAATGYSPHAYLTLRRLEYAKQMLRQGDLTITQIAYCCGFSSAAHFTTTFGKHLGATPSVYRASFE